MSFSEEEFVNAVREVLAERGPRYMYESPDEGAGCVYSADGGETGSCLFGAVLIEKLGVPYNEEWEGEAIDSVVVVYVDLSESAIDAARVAQGSQDARKPYDYVAREFEKWLRRGTNG